mmetsp:Transcript_10158/g.33905  ORF Transcript_10158/g.33905 Transcript_10158/m.33905 type:complete len:215 (-) Transcript_10158:2383-3027(-)
MRRKRPRARIFLPSRSRRRGGGRFQLLPSCRGESRSSKRREGGTWSREEGKGAGERPRWRILEAGMGRWREESGGGCRTKMRRVRDWTCSGGRTRSSPWLAVEPSRLSSRASSAVRGGADEIKCGRRRGGERWTELRRGRRRACGRIWRSRPSSRWRMREGGTRPVNGSRSWQGGIEMEQESLTCSTRLTIKNLESFRCTPDTRRCQVSPRRSR